MMPSELRLLSGSKADPCYGLQLRKRTDGLVVQLGSGNKELCDSVTWGGVFKPTIRPFSFCSDQNGPTGTQTGLIISTETTDSLLSFPITLLVVLPP